MYRLHKIDLAVIIHNQNKKEKKRKEKEKIMTLLFDFCVNASLGTQQVEVFYDGITLASRLMVVCICFGEV